MNKRTISLLLAGCMAASLCACGSTGTTAGNTADTESVELSTEVQTQTVTLNTGDGTESVESTETEDVVIYEYDTPASSTFNYHPADYVTTLPEYKGVPLTVSSDYEITDASLLEYLAQLMNYYSYDYYVELTDHDTVQDGDLVLVDYTGYLDGEAFDGGSATDQVVDVTNNSDAFVNTTYVDGFTDALKGAKVGDTVSGNVTFPENYGSDELAGQETVFEFNVKAIVRTITFEDLTDEEVAADFGSDYGFETVDEFKSAVENSMESKLLSAAEDALDDYILENSVVDIPEDYLEARLNEYIYQVAQNYCSDGQTFDEYLATYNSSVEDQMENFTADVTDTITLEWVLLAIAEKEGMEVDDDEYSTGIAAVVANSSTFTSEEDLYAYFGINDLEYGEKYMREQFLINNVMTMIVDNADITYSDEE